MVTSTNAPSGPTCRHPHAGTADRSAPDRLSLLSRAQAGRLAALLYIGSGAAGLVSLPFPQPVGADRTSLLIINSGALLVGFACLFAPWSRWPRPATLVVLPPAFALIALGNTLGGSVPYTYSLFFPVAFVWIGVSQARGVATAMAPLAVIAYILPLPYLDNDIGAGVTSALVVVPTCVLLGESLAWIGARFTRSRSALAHTEERFRVLVDAIEDYAIIMLDPHGLVASWNEGARRIYGYEATEIVGRHVAVFHSVIEVQQKRPAALLVAADDEGHVTDDGWRVRRDGTRFFASVTITAMRNEDGSLRGFAKITRDVTERREADEAMRRTLEALQQTDGERRRLLSRLVHAQEEERRRVAADIHDDTVQVMSAVAMRLDLMQQHVTDPDLQRMVGESTSVVHAAIDRLRRLIFALHPPVLDDEGLTSAVAAYVADQETQPGRPKVRLESHLTTDLARDVRVLAYRIVQEALSNAFKHACAAHVIVRLEQARGGVAIRIQDDGRGFAATGRSAASVGHIGLAAMREHAKLAGGKCVIRSVPGAGTTVDVWLPLETAVAPPEAIGGIAS
jgi:PAS domain S-box-containing protein